MVRKEKEIGLKKIESMIKKSESERNKRLINCGEKYI